MREKILCAKTVLLAVGITLASPACRPKTQPAPQKSDLPKIAEPAPPSLDVRDRPGLLFTYLDDKGALKSAERLGEIPASRRAGVRVIDLTLPPEQRGAGRYVFIADLREAKPDGSYPYQTLSQVTYEKALTSEVSGQKIDEALKQAPAQVTVYSTSWCGVCARAKSYLQAHNVSFVERDVEADSLAQAELAEKARRAGVVPQGVPVIDVYGELMLGFDEAALAAKLRQHGAKAGAL